MKSKNKIWFKRIFFFYLVPISNEGRMLPINTAIIGCGIPLFTFQKAKVDDNSLLYLLGIIIFILTFFIAMYLAYKHSKSDEE